MNEYYAILLHKASYMRLKGIIEIVSNLRQEHDEHIIVNEVFSYFLI